MNWREEKDNKIKLDRERSVKKYIKRELMNYYLYLDKVIELRIKRETLSALSNDPPYGGSFAKMPDGSAKRDGQPHKLAINMCDVETNLKYYENKLSVLDNWMNILTKSQHEVVKVYVLEYQCENMHEVSIILADMSNGIGYCEETINKYTKRAIDRIYSKINKIVNDCPTVV